MNSPAPSTPIPLELSDFTLTLTGRGRSVRILDHVDLRVGPGQIVGLVGESGSGKSVTALSMLRLLPPGSARVDAGSLRLMGEDVFAMSDERLRAVRGGVAGFIFQEPMTALSPALRIGAQIGDVLRQHRGLRGAAAREEAIRLLDSVRIRSPQTTVDAYPHELSGGMRQRVLIAMAFACNPALIIADEPTTALDVTVQAQILYLLRTRARETGAGTLLISHDLAVIAGVCDMVHILYCGRVVEFGPTADLIASPRHPYTAALIGARAGPHRPRGTPLVALPGALPDPAERPSGCVFHPRCPRALDECRVQAPPTALSGPRGLACWNPVPAQGEAV